VSRNKHTFSQPLELTEELRSSALLVCTGSGSELYYARESAQLIVPGAQLEALKDGFS